MRLHIVRDHDGASIPVAALASMEHLTYRESHTPLWLALAVSWILGALAGYALSYPSAATCAAILGGT